ncbi:hypothetical protein B0H13DRAFT_2463459 [Mycena leptocephala]|nr:hypothetical protein B0H13DRAFT_2463459 [Mycena leptocephala]
MGAYFDWERPSTWLQSLFFPATSSRTPIQLLASHQSSVKLRVNQSEEHPADAVIRQRRSEFETLLVLLPPPSPHPLSTSALSPRRLSPYLKSQDGLVNLVVNSLLTSVSAERRSGTRSGKRTYAVECGQHTHAAQWRHDVCCARQAPRRISPDVHALAPGWSDEMPVLASLSPTFRFPHTADFLVALVGSYLRANRRASIAGYTPNPFTPDAIIHSPYRDVLLADLHLDAHPARARCRSFLVCRCMRPLPPVGKIATRGEWKWLVSLRALPILLPISLVSVVFRSLPYSHRSPQSQHTLRRHFPFRQHRAYVTPLSLSTHLRNWRSDFSGRLRSIRTLLGSVSPASARARCGIGLLATFRRDSGVIPAFFCATHTFHSSSPRTFPITQLSPAFLPAAYRIPYIPYFQVPTAISPF